MKLNSRFVLALIVAQTSCKTSSTASSETSEVKTPAPSIVAYPQPDAELGERLNPDEIAISKEIGSVIEGQLRTRYAGTRVLRDAHPKSHGCVSAEFVVNPKINPDLAQGVFAPGSRYKATVRYSNSNADPTQPDIKGDGRGMAFKLQGVPGKKLLEVESEAGTQDFIMINHPVFFIADPQDYLSAVKKAGSSNIFSRLAVLTTLGFKSSKIVLAIQGKQISSPIQTEYFSELPYQLGTGPKRLAVRYKAEPCAMNGSSDVPKDTNDPNYLRHRLREHFQTKDACYTILAQVRTDDKMSVEDSRDEWNSPWQEVASLNMKGADQNIAETPGFEDPRNVACDTLSFNPWHALPEHKPLGIMNRMRKVIYEYISRFRHEMNKEERKEPA